ncbi:GTP-binding protein [Oribacterium sp. KHPX15]|uniref:GTPase ObgE n=1 Tax=Oribacterium sp. KHPX15 TaxID=1855342 RepID=UPI000895190C|nr:GTPase ObgE [Oribacterium sp. KHPX15]SDZ90280.1 GTP-binding protein [Oribacterium sp. KHPX15]
MFADIAKIFIKSGKGGNGHVSFRRELFVPAGGPDGGDGGKGGDIIVEVDKGMNTLEDFRNRQKYVATPGEEGGGKRMHGKNGKDLVIKVPEGTIIRDFETKKIIADMSGDNQRLVLLKGGKGGLGNMHFATPSMQAPKFAQPGQDARELWVQLELRVIADVGLVGLPNVGKSTILSMCSNARPEIANYHFTTLTPHLGVVGLKGDRSFVMADIPGLIEGASEGVGLGHEFLRHIERCKVLVHVVDASGCEGRDPVEDIKTINEEIEKYDPDILKKPMIIACNKTDLIIDEQGSDSAVTRIKEIYEPQGVKVFAISAATNTGLREVLEAAWTYVEEAGAKEVEVYESEVDLETLGHKEQLAIEYKKLDDSTYSVEGPKIEKMLGYTNISTEKGFEFFQRFMAEQGVIKTLRKMGIQEGDTIKIYGHTFEYYDTDAYEEEELEKAIDTAFPKRHQPKNNGEEE